MIKTVQFGSKDVAFSTNFAWVFVYKSQFGLDPAKVLMPVVKKINSTLEKQQKEADASENSSDDEEVGYMLYEELGLTGLADIAWSMARLADKSTPEPQTWVESFGDDFDMSALLQNVIVDAILSCFTSKKSKVLSPAATQATAQK